MKNIFFYSSPRNRHTLLLHYKKIGTEFNEIDTKHTNNWEISEILRSFLAIGWNIELVDRTCTNWKPSRHYAAGPAVDISDKLVDERYENFRLRHGVLKDTKHLRTFRTNINEIMSYVAEIICIDDNGFSAGTYSRFGKRIHTLRPSSSPNSFDGRLERFQKNRNGFMLFLGNGFIAKGADVVIDAFKDFPSAHLYVCGPYKEDKFFWNFYKKKMRNMSNIFLNGFVKVGSKQYFDLVSHSAWQLNNSAAEGSATSVTTLIQSGILPISN